MYLQKFATHIMKLIYDTLMRQKKYCSLISTCRSTKRCYIHAHVHAYYDLHFCTFFKSEYS